MRSIKVICVIAAIASFDFGSLPSSLTASQQQVQPPRPTTSEDIFRAVLRDAQPAINECRLRRLRGELPTFAASAECSNRRLIAAFSAAHYKYMDLIQYLAAKRVEVAEQIDRRELTEDQARQQSMKIIMQIIATEQKRDSSPR